MTCMLDPKAAEQLVLFTDPDKTARNVYRFGHTARGHNRSGHSRLGTSVLLRC